MISNRFIALAAALSAPVFLAGCDQSKETVAPHVATGLSNTASSGSSSTVLARAVFADPFKVRRKTDGWKVSVDSDPLDIAVQSIVFQPGSQSGWHMHPGPVFILVAEGEMTFYESDDPTCTGVVRKAGEGFLDKGDHAHLARNESGAVSRNVVTYLAPPGAALRIDAPDPGNCHFAP
jgi:cupin domain